MYDAWKTDGPPEYEVGEYMPTDEEQLAIIEDEVLKAPVKIGLMMPVDITMGMLTVHSENQEDRTFSILKHRDTAKAPNGYELFFNGICEDE